MKQILVIGVIALAGMTIYAQADDKPATNQAAATKADSKAAQAKAEPGAKNKAPKNKKANPDEIGNRDVDGKLNFYSIEREIAMGKQYAQDVERQARVIDDPIIAEYVNRIGQNLVRNSDAKVPFTIKVLDAQDVNAFALPGGFFFVNASSSTTLRSRSFSWVVGLDSASARVRAS
jgi:predicted Zn-dependent protease